MNPTTGKKKARGGVIALICVLLVVILLANSLVITRQNEYTVIKQFGTWRCRTSSPRTRSP